MKVKKLAMTDEEIVISYREAKSQKEQITILAQLNACQKADIIAVLERCGLEIPSSFLVNTRATKATRTAQKETSKPEYKDFAVRLRQVIDHDGRAQKDIAYAAGISQAVISRYVTARGLPRADIMERLAKTLHTTTEYLANGTVAESEGAAKPEVKPVLTSNLSEKVNTVREIVSDMCDEAVELQREADQLRTALLEMQKAINGAVDAAVKKFVGGGNRE